MTLAIIRNRGGDCMPAAAPALRARTQYAPTTRTQARTFVLQARNSSSSPRNGFRGFPMAISPHSQLPEVNGAESSAILAEMIREAFPGLTTAERCRRAGVLLGIHPRNVRRLEAGETAGSALHFYRLMKRLGVDRTLEIIDRVTGR